MDDTKDTIINGIDYSEKIADAIRFSGAGNRSSCLKAGIPPTGVPWSEASRWTVL